MIESETHYELMPDGDPTDEWIFWKWDDQSDGLRLRPGLAHLMCSACGKIDEIAALQIVDLAEVHFSGRMDVLSSGEDWLIVSDTMLGALKMESIAGWTSRKIDGSPRFSILIASLEVPTKLELAGFEEHDPCPKCGRPQERLCGPLGQGMEIPREVATLFRSSIWNESGRGKVPRIFATVQAVRLLKKHKLRGLVVIPGQ
jgi:hypothetical protein